MMEWFRHGSSGTFRDLAGSLHRAYADILASFARAFADILSRADWMQRHQISSALANTLGGVARALARTFADVSAATANVTPGTSLMRLRL